MRQMKYINVLGTRYSLRESTPKEDKILEDCDGYCDKTSRKIVVLAKPDTCDLDNYEIYKKK